MFVIKKIKEGDRPMSTKSISCCIFVFCSLFVIYSFAWAQEVGEKKGIKEIAPEKVYDSPRREKKPPTCTNHCYYKKDSKGINVRQCYNVCN